MLITARALHVIARKVKRIRAHRKGRKEFAAAAQESACDSEVLLQHTDIERYSNRRIFNREVNVIETAASISVTAANTISFGKL